MPLSAPMYAIPGELLTSTELQEDVDHNKHWKVPNSLFDISDHRIMLEYGDLWLVVASWEEWPDGKPSHQFDVEVMKRAPAILLHLPTTKLFKFDDIETVGWLWRPDLEIDKLRREARKITCKQISERCVQQAKLLPTP